MKLKKYEKTLRMQYKQWLINQAFRKANQKWHEDRMKKLEVKFK
jgi:hypothetical protein